VPESVYNAASIHGDLYIPSPILPLRHVTLLQVATRIATYPAFIQDYHCSIFSIIVSKNALKSLKLLLDGTVKRSFNKSFKCNKIILCINLVTGVKLGL
jgi:hypothetical protein